MLTQFPAALSALMDLIRTTVYREQTCMVKTFCLITIAVTLAMAPFQRRPVLGIVVFLIAVVLLFLPGTGKPRERAIGDKPRKASGQPLQR